MIQRTPRRYENEAFDLIVVGGGVYGAALALEATRRRLRPLLLEKDDFGGGTSANSLRILHGGLRYLQTADPVSFREAVKQRRWWLREFPELVRPLECLMPLYGAGLHRKAVLRPALFLNDLLSLDRNRGVRPTHRLPRGRVVGRNEVLRRLPLAAEQGLEGGAIWYDAAMVSSSRLIVEILRWSAALGAGLLNYVEARRLIQHGHRVLGVEATDRRDGRDVEFRAPVVINAAGPWCRSLAGDWASANPALFRPSLAYNVLIDRPLPFEGAVGAASRLPGGQMYFLRSMGRFTFAGTGHEPWPAHEPPPSHLPEPVLSRFIAHVRSALPGFTFTRRDVVRQFCGLLPARAARSVKLMRRPTVVNHAREGGPKGLVSVSGVKFTTAPAVAGQVLDLAFPDADRVGGTEDESLRPAVRTWIGPEDFRALRERSPEEARRLLATLTHEEAVTCMADLVSRRLDWDLAFGDRSRALELLEGSLGEGEDDR